MANITRIGDLLEQYQAALLNERNARMVIDRARTAQDHCRTQLAELVGEKTATQLIEVNDAKA
jgi:hypothetical protein